MPMDGPVAGARSISNSEIERIAKTIFADRRCASCGERNFDVAISDEDGVVSGVVFFDQATGVHRGYLPVLPLTCLACGSVELVNERWVMRRWEALDAAERHR
ncbi:MAG: hypothetical protein AAF192_06705 [Pseudomonadota bacterium]